MRTLLYSNVFIALAGGILTLGSFRLLSQAPELDISIWVFFSILAVYTAQRLLKLRIYDLGTEQMAWVVEQKKILVWATTISLSISLFLGFKMNLDVLFSLWPLALISLLYALPFIPSGKDRLALRELPMIKIFLIATVWTWITLLLPMKVSGMNIGAQEKAWLLERFIFIFAITIPFDIRDIGHDKASMRTIPQVIGVKGAGVLSLLLVFIAALLPLMSFYQGNLGGGHLSASLLVYGITFLALCFGLKKRPYWYYNGVLDGMMLFLGVSYVLF